MGINTVLIKIDDKDCVDRIEQKILKIAKGAFIDLSELYGGREDYLVQYNSKLYLPVVISGHNLTDELELEDFEMIRTNRLSMEELEEIENSPTIKL